MWRRRRRRRRRRWVSRASGRDASTVRQPDGQRLGRVLARRVDGAQRRVRVVGAARGLGAAVALAERAAVRRRRPALRAARSARLHVPAGVGGELAGAVTRAGGGRHGADGARQRLLVGVGGGGVPAVPRGRRGARARWASARALSCAVRPVARGRGAARGEQQRARVQRGRGAAAAGVGARARVQPWSGPRRGATVVGVRAVGAPARRRAVRLWRGGVVARGRGGAAAASLDASSASAARRASAASGVRCVSPASAVTGGCGVQLGGRRGRVERRQLPLPRRAVGGGFAAARPESAAARAWRWRSPRGLVAAAAARRRVTRGRATRRRCAAGWATARARCWRGAWTASQLECASAARGRGRGARVALGERAAVRRRRRPARGRRGAARTSRRRRRAGSCRRARWRRAARR